MGSRKKGIPYFVAVSSGGHIYTTTMSKDVDKAEMFALAQIHGNDWEVRPCTLTLTPPPKPKKEGR